MMQKDCRYWLEYRGHQVELRPGETIIGRSAGCQLVLEDALVSRKHARILLSGDTVTLADLASANGVYLNGERITEPCILAAGDRLLVGQQEMVLRRGAALEGRSPRSLRWAAVTLSGVDPSALGVPSNEPPPLDEDDATHHGGDAITLLGGVADKVLALGRGDEAEKILGNLLRNLLDKVRKNRAIANDAALEKAAAYAVKIASVTGNGKWVDYAIELFTHLERPLPAQVVDELYTVLRTIREFNRSALRVYAAMLREKQDSYGPNGRFLVQRIEGLARLAGLR